MAKNTDKSKEQLVEELDAAQRRIAELEAGDAGDGTSSEAMLETLRASVPEFMFFKDRKRRFVLASQRFADLFELELAGILGKRDEADLPVIRTTKLPWHDASGETIGLFGISSDITELRRAEIAQTSLRGLFRTNEQRRIAVVQDAF